MLETDLDRLSSNRSRSLGWNRSKDAGVGPDLVRAFLVTADVPEIYMQEFWATAKLHHNSIRFKMDTRKSVLDLEAFREMLHISPRIPSQSFVELPFEEEILEFLRCARNLQAGILGDCNSSSSLNQIEHKKQKKGIEMYYPRFRKVVIHHFMSKDLPIPGRNKINWHYVRDDNIFSTIKVVSRHQDTQQYGAILPIELTNEDIMNTTAYKEYYAYATGVAAPKPKASARKKRGDSDTSLTPPIATPTSITTVASVPRLSAAAKGKQPARATTHTKPTDVERTEAKQLKIVLRRSRQETHISQQRGSGTDEGTDVDAQDEGDKDVGNDDDNDETIKDVSKRDDDDDNDDKEELVKNDDEDIESGKGGDEVSKSERDSDEEETRQEEEESFDTIPRTPKGSKDEGNDEEDQDLRLSEEARIE
nr:hypothetical protein [Tanacetum cinerariifolium]